LTNITRGNARQRSRGRGQLCESPPIRHDVREDQREREEHETEEKVEKEVCPFRLATLAGQNAIAIQMMKNKIEPSHQPFAATNTGALSSTEADRAEHEPDYSGGAIRLALPTQSGTTIRVGRGGHSVTHIPPAPGVQTRPRPRTQVAAARGRPLRQTGVGLALPPQASPEDLPPRSWVASRRTFTPGPGV